MDHIYYDQLRAVAELPLDDSAERAEFERLTAQFADLALAVRQFGEAIGVGLGGQAGQAATAAANELLAQITDARTRVVGDSPETSPAWRAHQQARDAMREASAQFAGLSATLVPTTLESVILAAGTAIIPGLGPVAADAYLAWLTNQKNQAREQAAHHILTTMNAVCHAAAQAVPHYEVGRVDDHTGGWSDPGWDRVGRVGLVVGHDDRWCWGWVEYGAEVETA